MSEGKRFALARNMCYFPQNLGRPRSLLHVILLIARRLGWNEKKERALECPPRAVDKFYMFRKIPIEDLLISKTQMYINLGWKRVSKRCLP